MQFSSVLSAAREVLAVPRDDLPGWALPIYDDFASMLAPKPVDTQTKRREQLDSRIVSGAFAVYMLAIIQFINLAFIYTWISLQSEQAVVIAVTVLAFTPACGVIGAFLRNRQLLEMHHMVSQLLFASPLLWAMDVWDVERLPTVGYVFFAYQIMLLFYQYRAMKRILRLRRDIKALEMVGSVVIEA